MKYSELYPESTSNGEGLIATLSRIEAIPWSEYDEDLKLNLERLYGVRSGFKEVIDAFILVPEVSRAALLSALYADKWRRLWDNFKLSYNPLDAYKVSEKINSIKKRETTLKIAYGRETDSTSNDVGKVINTGTTSDDVNSKTFGFNSEAAVPVDVDSSAGSYQDTENRDIDLTTHTANSGEDNHTDNSTDTDESTVDKSGNIGYTSPQELIRQEFEIWGTPFFNLVFADIDQFITIQVY